MCNPLFKRNFFWHWNLPCKSFHLQSEQKKKQARLIWGKFRREKTCDTCVETQKKFLLITHKGLRIKGSLSFLHRNKVTTTYSKKNYRYISYYFHQARIFKIFLPLSSTPFLIPETELPSEGGNRFQTGVSLFIQCVSASTSKVIVWYRTSSCPPRFVFSTSISKTL